MAVSDRPIHLWGRVLLRKFGTVKGRPLTEKWNHLDHPVTAEETATLGAFVVRQLLSLCSLRKKRSVNFYFGNDTKHVDFGELCSCLSVACGFSNPSIRLAKPLTNAVINWRIKFIFLTKCPLHCNCWLSAAEFNHTKCFL